MKLIRSNAFDACSVIQAPIVSIRPLVLAVVMVFFGQAAQSAQLGNIRIRSALGEPLMAEVPVRLSPGETLGPGCVSVVKPVGSDVSTIMDARIQLRDTGDARSKLLVLTSESRVAEPAARLAVRVGCDSQISREYVAFFDPPDTSSNRWGKVESNGDEPVKFALSRSPIDSDPGLRAAVAQINRQRQTEMEATAAQSATTQDKAPSSQDLAELLAPADKAKERPAEKKANQLTSDAMASSKTSKTQGAELERLPAGAAMPVSADLGGRGRSSSGSSGAIGPAGLTLSRDLGAQSMTVALQDPRPRDANLASAGMAGDSAEGVMNTADDSTATLQLAKAETELVQQRATNQQIHQELERMRGELLAAQDQGVTIRTMAFALVGALIFGLGGGFVLNRRSLASSSGGSRRQEPSTGKSAKQPQPRHDDTTANQHVPNPAAAVTQQARGGKPNFMEQLKAKAQAMASSVKTRHQPSGTKASQSAAGSKTPGRRSALSAASSPASQSDSPDLATMLHSPSSAGGQGAQASASVGSFYEHIDQAPAQAQATESSNTTFDPMAPLEFPQSAGMSVQGQEQSASTLQPVQAEVVMDENTLASSLSWLDGVFHRSYERMTDAAIEVRWSRYAPVTDLAVQLFDERRAADQRLHTGDVYRSRLMADVELPLAAWAIWMGWAQSSGSRDHFETMRNRFKQKFGYDWSGLEGDPEPADVLIDYLDLKVGDTTNLAARRELIMRWLDDESMPAYIRQQPRLLAYVLGLGDNKS